MVKNGKDKSAKKSKRASESDGGALGRVVSKEAVRGVAGVLLVAISGFLILSEMHSAGLVGDFVYQNLYYLLGIGYLLLPLSLLLAAGILFNSFERRLGSLQLISIFVFLLSGLGLIAIAFPDRGGAAGHFVSEPLIAGIATPATIIFLIAAAIAAIILAFDLHIGPMLRGVLLSMRYRKEDGDAEESAVTGLRQEEQDDQEFDSDQDDGEEVKEIASPVPMKEAGTPAVRSFESENQGSFPIIAASNQAYDPPPVSILAKNKGKPEVGDVKANMNIVKRTLQNFGIQVEMDEASIGPTVTRYALKPAEGVRLSKIVALQSNLELALAASPVRIEAPIPGKSLVGLEVPNIARTTLGLAPLISDEGFTGSDKPLLIALGRSITGQPYFADLAKMPHLLVAGTTGAGKSVTIHDFIVSLLYRCGPERLRFIMVDPKRVELTAYNSIPHLLTPVITDAKKAILALKWLAKEMERRYNILETERVRDISSYHTNVVAPALEKAVGNPGTKLPEAMPYIVLIIDELADIMSTYPRELEGGIVRLAQMSRAVGIHLILSTQRPSVKVITGLIKANIPARVALQVASGIDSRTILDMTGAEKLLGSGDMLFLSGEMSKPRRIQAPYISETELKRVVAHIAKGAEGQLVSEINFEDTGRNNSNDPLFASMSDNEDDDELYGEAKRTIIEAGKASTSYLQRKLGIGYARAARLMDLLEQRGVIGPSDGAKPRDVIGASNNAVETVDTEGDASES